MCPQWNTQDRGQNREDETEDVETGWDGKSCSDHHQLPGRGLTDVEDLTMLSGLAHYESNDKD